MIYESPAPARRRRRPSLLHRGRRSLRLALPAYAWLLLGAGRAPAAPAQVPAAVNLAGARRALDAWQLEEARAVAERALHAQPDDDDARLLAAEVLHQRGQHDTAARLLPSDAKATALGRPEQARRRSLAPVLAASQAALAGASCRETAHFRLCFVDKDEVVATYAEQVLESAYDRIGAALHFLPAERGEKVAVEFLPNAEALAGATGLHVREIETSGTIAVCRYHRLMVLSPLAVDHGYAWADTLAHEFVHLVVSKASHNRVPVWLHEGLAKTLESRWRQSRPARLEPHAEASLRRAVVTDTLVPLSRMHPSMAKLASQQEAALAFAEVFSLVEHVAQREGLQAFVRLLAALGRGEAFDAALGRHVAPLPLLERRWRAALRARYRAPADADADAEPTPAAPTLRLASEGTSRDAAGAARGSELASHAAGTAEIGDANVRAVARLGELLAARGHSHAAARNFAAAHALGASRYPKLSFAFAQALVDDGRPQEARATLAGAVARGQLGDGADDGQAEAQWCYAQLLADANACAPALRFLRGYNLRNPFRAEVHALAARCYAKLGDAVAAARERQFAELAGRPRRGVPPSTAPAEAASLSALPPHWDPLRLDDGPARPAPLWREPVAAGRHCVAFDTGNDAAAARACALLRAGEHATLRP